MTPHELLAAVDKWLWKLCLKAARNLPVDPDDLHQDCAVRVLLSGHTFDAAKGRPATWATMVFRSCLQRSLVVADRRNRVGRQIDAEVFADLPHRTDDDATPDDTARAVQLLDTLPDRDRAMIARRFGLHGGEPETLSVIATRFGVSKERVRQIERRALAYLRELAA